MKAKHVYSDFVKIFKRQLKNNGGIGIGIGIDKRGSTFAKGGGAAAAVALKMRREAEKVQSDAIEVILAGNDCAELKRCIISLWGDLDAKKKSCDEKAGRLMALELNLHELDKLKARSEELEISEAKLRKRMREKNVTKMATATAVDQSKKKRKKAT